MFPHGEERGGVPLPAADAGCFKAKGKVCPGWRTSGHRSRYCTGVNVTVTSVCSHSNDDLD